MSHKLGLGQILTVSFCQDIEAVMSKNGWMDGYPKHFMY